MSPFFRRRRIPELPLEQYELHIDTPPILSPKCAAEPLPDTELYDSCGILGFGKSVAKLPAADCGFVEDRRMKVVASNKTFAEAKELIHPSCRMLGREDFDDHMAQTILFLKNTSQYVWVDARRTNSGMEWADGTPMRSGRLGYWRPGEPNNSGGNENRVNVRPDGTLNDIHESARLSVVEVCPVLAPYRNTAPSPYLYQVQGYTPDAQRINSVDECDSALKTMGILADVGRSNDCRVPHGCVVRHNKQGEPTYAFNSVDRCPVQRMRGTVNQEVRVFGSTCSEEARCIVAAP